MFKKIIAAVMLVASAAVAAFPNDVWIKRSNNTDTGTVEYTINTEVDGITWFNITSQRVEYLRFGNGLSRQLIGDYYYLNVGPVTPAAHTHQATDIIDSTAVGRSLMNASNEAAARVAIGAGTGNSNFSGAYADLTGKPALATVATSGSYADLANKPTIPTVNTPSQATASRSLNTAFQVSSTRPALVSYSVQLTVTASIAGGQTGDVALEIASDSGFTANVQTVAIAGLGQTYTLAIALQGVQPQTGVVSGFVPTGYYARLRTVNVTGTPTYAYRAGQEVLL